MTSNPATVSNGLEARVEKLEIWVTHQDRIIEELNRATTAQSAQIASLTRQIKSLADRVSQVEHSGAADPSAEPPPPHY
jgi:SlyX protein